MIIGLGLYWCCTCNMRTQLTRCVGKYLYALNPDVINEERLLDVNPVEGYLEDLQRGSGMGAECVLCLRNPPRPLGPRRTPEDKGEQYRWRTSSKPLYPLYSPMIEIKTCTYTYTPPDLSSDHPTHPTHP